MAQDKLRGTSRSIPTPTFSQDQRQTSLETTMSRQRVRNCKNYPSQTVGGGVPPQGSMEEAFGRSNGLEVPEGG